MYTSPRLYKLLPALACSIKLFSCMDHEERRNLKNNATRQTSGTYHATDI